MHVMARLSCVTAAASGHWRRPRTVVLDFAPSPSRPFAPPEAFGNR